MKFEHLIQAYKVNNIKADVETMDENNERAGTIKFDKGIASAYLLDDEDIVISLKMFFNCLGGNTMSEQLSHSIKVLNLIQQTIILLSNVSKKECNMIIEKLGLLDSSFKGGKMIKHLDFVYRVEVIDGLLCFSLDEVEEE